MPYKWNPVTGKYDIPISLEDARAEGYGNMSDQEKRAAYDSMVQTNPYDSGPAQLTDSPSIGQEYTSLNKSGSDSNVDYDYLDSIGYDTETLRKRGSGRAPTGVKQPRQVIAYGDNPAMWNQFGGLTPYGTVQYIADPAAQAKSAQQIYDRVKIIQDELDKRGAEPNMKLLSAGLSWDSIKNLLSGFKKDPTDLSNIATQQMHEGKSFNEAIHTNIIDSLTEDAQRDLLDAAYTMHPAAGTEIYPEGMVPNTDNYGMNPYYSIEPFKGHTLEFTNPVKLKEAYINALNLGISKGMIPAGARIGDATVTGVLSEITGMPASDINRLGASIAGAGASALMFGATGNFPLSAMAYFGVNSLTNNLTGKSSFNGMTLGEAKVDGISIPQLKMTLPTGLPNAIFSDYRYICYDRVSLKWYPSDEISPLNYDGGNDYRWLCLDRVTGQTFKCNIVKRPRIFLD